MFTLGSASKQLKLKNSFEWLMHGKYMDVSSLGVRSERLRSGYINKLDDDSTPKQKATQKLHISDAIYDADAIINMNNTKQQANQIMKTSNHQNSYTKDKQLEKQIIQLQLINHQYEEKVKQLQLQEFLYLQEKLLIQDCHLNIDLKVKQNDTQAAFVQSIKYVLQILNGIQQ